MIEESRSERDEVSEREEGKRGKKDFNSVGVVTLKWRGEFCEFDGF